MISIIMVRELISTIIKIYRMFVLTSWSSDTHSLSVTSRQTSSVSGTGSGHSSTYTVVHLARE